MLRKRLSLATSVVAATLFFAQASALAVDTFVEPDTGSDANNCTQAAVGGAGVGPCATIGDAVTKAASTAGTVHIDRGDSYAPTVILSGGVSLLGEELNPASDVGPNAVLDPGLGSAIFIDIGQSAGTIQGLTLRGNTAGIFSQGTVGQITQNVFDDPTAGSTGVYFFGASVSPLVNLNTFTGPGGTATGVGIEMGDGAATVRDNTFSGYNVSIYASGTGGAGPTSTPTIASNIITGVHSNPSSGGAGILMFNGSNATIVDNRVSAPGAGSSFGISVAGASEPATTGATLRRNRVTGAYTHGIQIADTGLPVSFNSDLVSGATNAGFNFEDQGAPSPLHADATATNITAWGNGADVSTFQNVLTLDSSILEDPVDDLGGTTCAISFSRGPTTIGTPCESFQTTADPLFVNAGTGDFHLQASSPMIDAGNPAAPLAGVLDLDGEPRALDATPTACADLVQRRDIGADEFFVAQPFCPTPVPAAAATKKCRKGQKLKKGKCAKRKRKKRK